MGYRLSELGADILSDVAVFCEREAEGIAKEADRTHSWPEELYAKAAGMGLGALFVPEEQDGLPLQLEERAAILEEIARTDAGLALAYMVNYIAMVPVEQFGSEELIRRCCRMLTSGRFGCFALTEDQAGSNINGIRTRAERKGSEYVINGSKAFVSNAGVAGFYVVFAQTPEGMAAFAVDAETEGITTGPEEKKLGIRNASTREVAFADVHVPQENMLGEPGDGRKIAMHALNLARTMCGIAATGLAQKALDLSVERAKERIQFGKPLAASSVIQTKLADMHMRTAAARACCIEALRMVGEADEDIATASATAKCLAADAACFCADEAVQIYGGCGYCEEYPVEKLLRDAKAFQIIEGTGEILRLNIGRKLAGNR